ncbi:alpha/beta fold hydrolase [Allosphingosinicella sp.]|uniref:alpha/beta fold hydrolase n=1 Tax=Allosphingosinicella sp. TaxID=2823234 RepID=UPI002F22C76D
MLRSESGGDQERMRRALAGLRRYQEAERRPPLPLMPAVAEAGGAVLRDYGGEGSPVLFVPSLINPPSVLDLSEERSLLRWLAGRGHRVLLLDWGWPDGTRRKLSVAGHVEQILLPLMGGLGERPALVGYCLGGTIALAAAQLGGVRSVATIAAPWRFSGFPDEARSRLAGLWARSKPTAEALGVLPMEVLQSAFWSLDPARTVAKFEAFAYAEDDKAGDFVALEDWANDGPPLAGAAALELFQHLFGEDRPGRGEWLVGGEPIDPTLLPCPFLNVVSTVDRIVPDASAAPAGERLELDLGHVGMIVGRRARDALWEPLADWLSRTAARC